MKTFIYNCKIITNGKCLQNEGILVEDGEIVGILKHPPKDCRAVNLGGAYLAPGFIDLHCHGGGGYEFIDGTEEAFLRACELHSQHGTRLLYPTISATDTETMRRALHAIAEGKERASLRIGGAHLEGPYLAKEMCGAQSTSVIRPPDPKEYEALADEFGGLIARWDYAPECDPDGAFLSFLQNRGIVGASAHTAAEYSHMLTAYKGGNRLVTHLYSCTSTVTRNGGFRRLGVIESAFLLDGIFVEAIGDGCHLPAELLQLIVKIKGADRVALVTDSIRFAGRNAGVVTGDVSYLIEDGVAKLIDRSAFAGSIATADTVLKRTVAAGISLPDTVRMLTETPARVMGLSRMGRIAEGYEAVFTVFDENYEIINTKELGM